MNSSHESCWTSSRHGAQSDLQRAKTFRTPQRSAWRIICSVFTGERRGVPCLRPSVAAPRPRSPEGAARCGCVWRGTPRTPRFGADMRHSSGRIGANVSVLASTALDPAVLCAGVYRGNSSM